MDVIKVPVKEEVITQNKTSEWITDEYCICQAWYRFLVMAMLDEKIGLSRLDKRMEEAAFIPVPEEKKDFYQKYESSTLNYLYLRSFVHIERLSADDRELLKIFSEEQNETTGYQIAEMIERTWKKVLVLDFEGKSQMVEEYKSLDNSGLFEKDTILLGISCAAKYDEQGNYVDKDAEKNRVNTIYSVASQLEKICSKILKAKIKVVVSV